MAFAGVPPVLIGRNEHVAWTSTTATGDNLDHYIETTCNAGAGPGSGYLFNGACTPFEARVETINVRGASGDPERAAKHSRTVVGSSGANLITQKRSHWQRELESVHAFIGFDRARNIQQFEAAVKLIPTSHNFIYADKIGNIAYWQAGQIPLRPAGFDARLPFPGNGSAEWPGGTLAIPTSINPAQGYLANWNNKPSVDYDNGDNQIFGKQFRNWDIIDRLSTGVISLEDMRDIPKDIARVKALGREARFLKPHLLTALSDVPPAHPLAAQAKSIVEAWDGNAFSDAVTSTSLHSGEVIFSTWLSLMLTNTFGDELGARVGEASSNMLIHTLDFALTGDSGVPPESRLLQRDQSEGCYVGDVRSDVGFAGSSAGGESCSADRTEGLDYVLASTARRRSERPKLKSRHLWTDHRSRPPGNHGRVFSLWAKAGSCS